MKLSTKFAAVLVAVLLGLVLWTVWKPQPVDLERPSEPSFVAGLVAPETPQSPVDSADSGLNEKPRSSERKAVDPEPRKIQQAHADCIVIGQVVDQDGDVVAGAQVQLSGYEGWASGVAVPRLQGPYDMRGFETLTDDEGLFRFEAPVPTVDGVRLSITPQRFTDSYLMYLDPAARGGSPKLEQGLRDLGTIVLAKTGAVSGRVVDEFGNPVEGVKMGVGPTESLTYGRDAYTADDGTYVIAHAPAGTYGVKANSKAHLFQFRTPITVQAGQDTPPVDFVLVAAPTIEGLVVDSRGKPIEGASVEASGPGRGARMTTDWTGYFVLHLISDGAHTVSVKRKGFASWGGVGQLSDPYEPGTRGLEIVLTEVEVTRFFVLDDSNGQPLERFGLKVHEGYGSKAKSGSFIERRAARDSDHPGGIATATCREGLDVYVIGAKGFRMSTGDVRFDEKGKAQQTVRLKRKKARKRPRKKRDAHIAGQVLVPIGIDAGGLKVYLDDWRKGVTATTRSDGRFEFRELRSGTHRLTLEGRPGLLANLKAEKVRLRSGETQEVMLDARGQAMCEVSLSIELPGVDLQGVQVHLVSESGAADRPLLGRCDSQGRVRGAVRAFGWARVDLLGLGGLHRVHPASLELLPGGSLQRSLKFDSSTLDVNLPEEVQLPARGQLKLVCSSLDPGGVDQAFSLWMKDGKAMFLGKLDGRLVARKLSLPGIAPGRYQLVVELAECTVISIDDAAKYGGPLMHSEGELFIQKPAFYTASQEILLVSGETLNLSLR